jgi:hypothetical protein
MTVIVDWSMTTTTGRVTAEGVVHLPSMVTVTGQVVVDVVPRLLTRVALTLTALPRAAVNHIINTGRLVRPVEVSTTRHLRSSSSLVVLIVVSSMVRRLSVLLRPNRLNRPTRRPPHHHRRCLPQFLRILVKKRYR